MGLGNTRGVEEARGSGRNSIFCSIGIKIESANITGKNLREKISRSGVRIKEGRISEGEERDT